MDEYPNGTNNVVAVLAHTGRGVIRQAINNTVAVLAHTGRGAGW